jgi:hypothetical protein
MEAIEDLAGEQAQKGECIHRRSAFLVVVEVDIDVAITPLPHLD